MSSCKNGQRFDGFTKLMFLKTLLIVSFKHGHLVECITSESTIFHYVHDTEKYGNITEAENICNEIGGTLPMVNSLEDFDELKQLLEDKDFDKETSSNHTLWLGAKAMNISLSTQPFTFKSTDGTIFDNNGIQLSTESCHLNDTQDTCCALTVGPFDFVNAMPCSSHLLIMCVYSIYDTPKGPIYHIQNHYGRLWASDDLDHTMTVDQEATYADYMEHEQNSVTQEHENSKVEETTTKINSHWQLDVNHSLIESNDSWSIHRRFESALMNIQKQINHLNKKCVHSKSESLGLSNNVVLIFVSFSAVVAIVITAKSSMTWLLVKSPKATLQSRFFEKRSKTFSSSFKMQDLTLNSFLEEVTTHATIDHDRKGTVSIGE